MRIWHISDTHTFHELLEIPEDIGDYSKYGDYLNLRLYSEHEHHEAQLQMEIGC